MAYGSGVESPSVSRTVGGAGGVGWVGWEGEGGVVVGGGGTVWEGVVRGEGRW